MVDGDASFSEQFFDVALGQAVAHIPAHGDRDHLVESGNHSAQTSQTLEAIT